VFSRVEHFQPASINADVRIELFYTCLFVSIVSLKCISKLNVLIVVEFSSNSASCRVIRMLLIEKLESYVASEY